MKTRRIVNKRGGFFRIATLAEIIGVSETAVIAAQRLCGHVRRGHLIWCTHGVTVGFVEEARAAFAAEQAAAKRRFKRRLAAEQNHHPLLAHSGEKGETCARP